MNQLEILNKHYYYYSDPSMVSIDDPMSEVRITVYPNPTYGILHIKTDFNESLNLQLFSMDGQLLLETSSEQGIESELDLQTYPRGLYLLKIESNGKKFSEKIVLE